MARREKRKKEEPTQYEFGNNRYDLMTDEEVRTLYSGDLESLIARLADHMRQGESSLGADRYHRLYELYLRYPDRDFRLEPITEVEGTR